MGYITTGRDPLIDTAVVVPVDAVAEGGAIGVGGVDGV